MKNPSEPSRIGSATSYIALVPVALSRIEPSIQMLNAMNPTDVAKAVKAIVLATVFEMKIQKIRMEPGTIPSAPNLNADIPGFSIILYQDKIMSAYGSGILGAEKFFLSF